MTDTNPIIERAARALADGTEGHLVWSFEAERDWCLSSTATDDNARSVGALPADLALAHLRLAASHMGWDDVWAFLDSGCKPHPDIIS